MKPLLLAPVLGLATLVALPAAAQDAAQTGAQAAGGRTLSFDLGLGVKQVPIYPGADDTEATEWLILRNIDVDYGPGGGTGRRAGGFYVGPSFAMVGGRSEDEDEALEGMDDIDRSYELGLRAGWRFQGLNTYAAIRKGFGGHDGLVGEIGTRYAAPLGERLTLTSGIAADYGDADYMGTFFGVSADEAAASGYDAYDPDGGWKSVSATMELRYQMTPANAILGRVKAERLIGDAADSPLVQDRDQITLGLGFVHTFNFRF